MNDKPFLDTNILIYAFAADDLRTAVAESLVRAGGTVSVQVLNEFVNVCRRKFDRVWRDVMAMLGVLDVLLGAPLPVTVETHRRGLQLARDYGFQFYDALIVSAALGGGCTLLYSEDLQDGHRVDGLLIRNPFRAIV
jgi:predicted nucleic acid-binding protein